MRARPSRGGRRDPQGYIPSVDGLRGLFMALFLVAHFGLPHTDGLWLAINLFFVMSGFLITRLLLKERVLTGRIDAWQFYKRRARRLLPGLLLVLITVTVWGLTLAPDGQRRRIGGDILAALGFGMNWRLVEQGDQYFGDRANPSPLRHVWTLAIEEQYYVLIPLLLFALVAAFRTRRQVALALVALTAAFSVATVWVAAGDPTFPRLYYGTDTRVAALLLGSALGAWFAPDRHGRVARLPRAWVAPLAWGGLVSMLVAFFFVMPYSDWVWQYGGMTAANLAAAAVMIGLADPACPRPLARVFEMPALREVGRLTYSLYLWHWPVLVALLATPIAGRPLLIAIIGLPLTAAISWVSDRYVETPILRGGWRALFPTVRNPVPLTVVVVVAIALVVGLTLVRAPAPRDLAQDATSMAAAPQIVQGQPEYAPGEPKKVGMIGDSVPWYLAERFPDQIFPGVTPVNLAHEGCDLLDAPLVNAFETKPTTAECQERKDTWPSAAQEQNVDTVLVWGSILLSLPHELPDGRVTRLGEPEHTRLVEEQLDRMKERAHAADVRDVHVVNVPCREFVASRGNDELAAIEGATPEYLEEYDDPTRVNEVLEGWVEEQEDVELVDLHAAVCEEGYEGEIQDLQLYDDGVHFSPEATPMIWRWLLGQVSALRSPG